MQRIRKPRPSTNRNLPRPIPTKHNVATTTVLVLVAREVGLCSHATLRGFCQHLPPHLHLPSMIHLWTPPLLNCAWATSNHVCMYIYTYTCTCTWAHEGSARKLTDALRGDHPTRRAVVQPILMRRGRRWFDDPSGPLDGIFRFAARAAASVLTVDVVKTWLYGWCTSARFAHPVEQCRLCHQEAGDRQAHYLSCEFVRRWMSDRLGLTDLPAEDAASAFFLRAIGARGDGATNVSLALDAILFAVDANRHGARQQPVAILDAHLKEMRRHK